MEASSPKQRGKELEGVFGDLYNVDRREQVIVNMRAFDSVRSSSYFLREPVSRNEVELRMKILKNIKRASEYKVGVKMREWE